MRIVLLACPLLLLAGCSGGGDEDAAAGKQQQQEHVWSEQTNTINKARNVENVLGDAAARQRQQIEEQSQ